jgi:hypothetical protein
MAEESAIVSAESLFVDCRALAGFIVDVAPRELQGRRATQEGYADVVLEIQANQATWGTQVGITSDDIQFLGECDERVASIDEHLNRARKLVEVLEETRAMLDTARHVRISTIAAMVDARTRTRTDSSLLAVYEKTRAYRSAIAVKAAKTRRKNAEAEPGLPELDPQG